MKRILKFSALLGVCGLALPAFGQSVAITEFMVNPDVVLDNEGEFVELFNYGEASVNLNGWTISDEDSDSAVITEQDLFLPSGGYLVLCRNKLVFEAEFFGGMSTTGVVEIDGLVLGNSGDEIILSDTNANVVWSVAYMNDDSGGVATFLAEPIDDVLVWGSKAEPGVVRDGDDSATGTLGYQGNDVTVDPFATTGVDGNIASPLAGGYTSGGGVDPVAGDLRIISIEELGQSQYRISFLSDEPGEYELEVSTTTLEENAFSPGGDTDGGEGTVETIDHDAGGAPQAFFRVRRLIAQ